MTSNRVRPPRPLGLSLAIIVTLGWFSVLPLLQVGILFALQQRFNDTSFMVEGVPEDVQPIAAGGNFGDGANTYLLLQTIAGVLFIPVAIFAWRGRPSLIRWVMLASVVVLTCVTLVVTGAELFAQQSLLTGFDAGQRIAQTLLSGRLVITLLVPLYTLWYMNRAPSRLFYQRDKAAG